MDFQWSQAQLVGPNLVPRAFPFFQRGKSCGNKVGPYDITFFTEQVVGKYLYLGYVLPVLVCLLSVP